MAIDSELEDEQKARRKLEVHQLCERFKWASFASVRRRASELYARVTERAATLPARCEASGILREIEKDQAFQRRSALFRFWHAMFTRSYPTSWWTQFSTLVTRNFRVILRDPRLTIARLLQSIVLSVFIGLVFMRLKTTQSVGAVSQYEP